jgi:hypothetical protein
MKTYLGIVQILVLLCTSSVLSAQSGPEIGKRMSENLQALRQYSWKMRTEIQVDGKTQNTTLQLLRFDIDGKLQKTPLGAPPPQKKAKGIRGRKMKQKQEEMQTLIQGLSQTTMAYLHPYPDQVSQFLQKANIWEGKRGETGGTTRVEGTGFIKPQDSVNYYVASDTHQPTKMDAKTVFNEKPMQIAAEYRNLPDGPTYVARVIVDYPETKMRLIIENFDYTLQK